MDKICCVFVCNGSFLPEFKKTAYELRLNGLWDGDIILIIGDDLDENLLKLDQFIIEQKIKLLKFKNIVFDQETKEILESIKTDGRNLTKKFQWHKLHVFNDFFKQWDYVFYLDCGMKIHSNIEPILKLRQKNSFIGQSDNYPDNGWDLSVQFDKTNKLFDRLNEKYQLNIDYPQTGLMLFDTNLITENLFEELLTIVKEYPITKTNEQAYVSLYFTNINKKWVNLKIGDEDKYYYHPFRLNKDKDYIITKYN